MLQLRCTFYRLNKNKVAYCKHSSLFPDELDNAVYLLFYRYFIYHKQTYSKVTKFEHIEHIPHRNIDKNFGDNVDNIFKI